MKNLIKIVIVSMLIVSCQKEPDYPITNYTLSGGVYIVNEGNFRSGNGSLSFYSYDSLKIFNDLFYSVNGRPLGDVPNSIALKDNNIYIVVNNSGKIEILDRSTLKSLATIQGLNSPRNISFINENKAYVSSLYSDSLTIVNLSTFSISGYINIRRTSESIAVTGNKVFIANWTGGKEIMVVNANNDKLSDSIEVGHEPESMVFDKYGMLWVLCNGGWARQYNAELIEINPAINQIVKTFTFPTIEESPTCLKIDGVGQTLYYLDNGIRQMDIGASALPATTFIIQGSGEYFYKIGVNPVNSDIFVTDAVDFVQQGYVLIYKNDGSFVSKQQAGIIPGSMLFRLTLETSND